MFTSVLLCVPCTAQSVNSPSETKISTGFICIGIYTGVCLCVKRILFIPLALPCLRFTISSELSISFFLFYFVSFRLHSVFHLFNQARQSPWKLFPFFAAVNVFLLRLLVGPRCHSRCHGTFYFTSSRIPSARSYRAPTSVCFSFSHRILSFIYNNGTRVPLVVFLVLFSVFFLCFPPFCMQAIRLYLLAVDIA